MKSSKSPKSPKSRKTKKTITVPSNVLDKKIYIAAKRFIKKKAKVWPSAYASAQVVQEYKRRGGTYKSDSQSTTKSIWDGSFDPKGLIK